MSRIGELRQEVRDVLGATLPPAASVDGARGEHLLVRTEPAGKTVRVWGTGYGTALRVARRRVHMEYTIAVEVVQEYTDPAQAGAEGPVPDATADAFIDWVEENVFGLLNDRGVEIKDRLLGAFWPHTCEVAVVLDPAALAMKVLRSVVEVAYREQVEG